MFDQLGNAIKFLENNGWDVEIVGTAGKCPVFKCSVGDFSFNIAERPTLMGGTGVLTVLLPEGNEEVWSLIQLVQSTSVEVVRADDHVAME